MIDHTAIILAGGRGRRLGGIDKPRVQVGGSSLGELAVEAARLAGCAEIVVVGAIGDDVVASPGDPANHGGERRIRVIREDPPFGGPAAALVAALAEVRTPWVLLLAADLPRACEAVALVAAASPRGGADGIRLRDAAGRPQHLLARYRTSALRRASAEVGDPHGAPLGRLLDGLTLDDVDDPDGLSRDVDTWEDVWTARTASPAIEGALMPDEGTPVPPEALDAWAAAVADRLGLRRDDLPVSIVLDLARDVAHGVARPAAPLSAFAAGLAAGRAGGSRADVEAAMTAVVDLARDWRIA